MPHWYEDLRLVMHYKENYNHNGGGQPLRWHWCKHRTTAHLPSTPLPALDCSRPFAMPSMNTDVRLTLHRGWTSVLSRAVWQHICRVPCMHACIINNMNFWGNITPLFEYLESSILLVIHTSKRGEKANDGKDMKIFLLPRNWDLVEIWISF